MIAYEGPLEILHQDFKKIGLQEYVFVGHFGEEELFERYIESFNFHSSWVSLPRPTTSSRWNSVI